MHKNLINKTDEALKAIGMPIINHPVFYNCPVAIRFEIGDTEIDYREQKKKYTKAAHKRVNKIFTDFDFDILRIDATANFSKSKEKAFKNILKLSGLPFPTETRVAPFMFNGKFEEDNEKIECYWEIKTLDIKMETLLKFVVLSDFYFKYKDFGSSVFFIDSKQNLMFYLYDDRGLDLVAEKKETLLPCFEKYNEYILEDFKEEIESLFEENLR